MSVLKTWIIAEETPLAFTAAFDEAVAKIQAIGSGIHQKTYEFRDGKFIAFLAYSIPERQQGINMALSVAELRAVERASYEPIHHALMHNHQASTAQAHPVLPSTSHDHGGRIIRPATTGIGRRRPSGLGHLWHRFSSHYQRWIGRGYDAFSTD